jgi:hypothetical protein
MIARDEGGTVRTPERGVGAEPPAARRDRHLEAQLLQAGFANKPARRRRFLSAQRRTADGVNVKSAAFSCIA